MVKSKLTDVNRVLGGLTHGATFDSGPPSKGWARYALRHPGFEPIIMHHRVMDDIRWLLEYDNGSYVLNERGRAVAADIDLPLERCMQPYRTTSPEASLRRRARKTMKKLFTPAPRHRRQGGRVGSAADGRKGWDRHWGCRRINADEMAALKPYLDDFDDTDSKPSKRLNAAGIELITKRRPL
jgi:hypothetical protein